MRYLSSDLSRLVTNVDSTNYARGCFARLEKTESYESRKENKAGQVLSEESFSKVDSASRLRRQHVRKLLTVNFF